MSTVVDRNASTDDHGDKRNRSTDDHDDWKRSIKVALGAVDGKYVQACSISVVPEQLKEANKDAYMPKVVTMGPLYKGTCRDLLRMEEVKLRYMLSLFHRTQDPEQSFDECCKAILDSDKEVRASYVDEIKLNVNELCRTMLYDGCFLLELLINASQELKDIPPSSLDPPAPGPEAVKVEEVLSDLTMLENQIPVLVLHKLSRILFPNVFVEENNVAKINKLALPLFGYSQVSSPNAPHFLELVHSSIPGKLEVEETQQSVTIEKMDSHVEVKLSRCAIRLQAAGVTIKPPLSDSGVPLNVISTLVRNVPAVEVRGFDFDIRFSNPDGTLQIPQLHITKTTKAKWCNFIAWEHNKISSIAARDRGTNGLTSKSTSSALIFNDLICCAADVQLLKDKNIIVDHLKMSNKELITFFRSISKGIDHGIVDSPYNEMFNDLNLYSSTFRIKQIWTMFWHCYVKRFYNFLTRGYNFVALVVPALTVWQLVYAALAYHQHI